MKNILLDINIILDCYDNKRLECFPESKNAFDFAIESNLYQTYISSTSLDNIEFLKKRALRQSYPETTASERHKLTVIFVKELLTHVKLAKNPSYIDIDYDDIEDSLVIASAKAMDAMVITRDEGMIKKHPNLAFSPDDFINMSHVEKSISFLDLKSLNNVYLSEFEQAFDQLLNGGWYIQGQQCQAFEQEFSTYCGTKHCYRCC